MISLIVLTLVYLMKMSILRYFRRPKLDPVAFDAYWNKLPENIGVSWFRDGKYIVGNIETEGESFMTQGRNADEFVDMVNETVYAVYDIPEEYHSALREVKREFIPKEDQYEKLNNTKVRNSFFSLKKASKPQLA